MAEVTTNDLKEELERIDAALSELGETPAGALQTVKSDYLNRRKEVAERLEALRIEQRTVSSGDQGISVGGDSGDIYYVGEGGTLHLGGERISTKAVDQEQVLAQYLQHIATSHRYLQLQGIRSGGKLVHIELDRIYIRLRATRQRRFEEEEAWLAEEAKRAPGERHRLAEQAQGAETAVIGVEQALAEHQRLVVLGDPGSGKTTLLRYLTLPYARDLGDAGRRMPEKLGIDEPRRLPILLELRRLGKWLGEHAPDDGADGHALLLRFLLAMLKNEDLPEAFFDPWLGRGDAAILLDGLDEVADPKQRNRVARLVEDFVRHYPQCRYVVTSRIVGYTGTARLGEGFVTTTVRDFSLEDVECFLGNWHRLVALGERGDIAPAWAHAQEQTRQLLEAIRGNSRIRDLAINPLMLTVIALVHRDRVKLPDRRAELYAEAVDVLLGKWDEAREIHVEVLPGRSFDAGDKRLKLQAVALEMQRNQTKEIEAEGLQKLLTRLFRENIPNDREAERAAKRFIDLIRERSGLLTARGEGVYAFSHLTFQEYLAALGLAAGDDYIEATLEHAGDPWWRETILLEAGHLSTQSAERATRLIEALARRKSPDNPYANLVLAAECFRDVGEGRVREGLHAEVTARLKRGINTPPPFYASVLRFAGPLKKLGVRGWIEQRALAMEALTQAGSGYWKPPYGEPEWVEVPEGEFWMGSETKQSYDDERPAHQVHLPTFWIAKTPISNAQYHVFTQATGHQFPEHWGGERPPKGLESHPVVKVSFKDALAYCNWLGEQIGRAVTLPSEAEWEKAARGGKDRREYPWGDRFDASLCNSVELGWMGTTPVGIFPDGASPFGCLDMAGNVWEWTRSLSEDYPYPAPGERVEREALGADGVRVLRGGAFHDGPGYVRCASRNRDDPDFRGHVVGFRVAASPFSDR